MITHRFAFDKDGVTDGFDCAARSAQTKAIKVPLWRQLLTVLSRPPTATTCTSCSCRLYKQLAHTDHASAFFSTEAQLAVPPAQHLLPVQVYICC